LKRASIVNIEQFESFNSEYSEKYEIYRKLSLAIEQNKMDFTELGREFNLKSPNGSSSATEKKGVETKIQEVYASRKDLVIRMRRKYEYLHDELSDLKRCLDEFVKQWANPPL
jgi:hypothetical protein